MARVTVAEITWRISRDAEHCRMRFASDNLLVEEEDKNMYVANVNVWWKMAELSAKYRVLPGPRPIPCRVTFETLM